MDPKTMKARHDEAQRADVKTVATSDRIAACTGCYTDEPCDLADACPKRGNKTRAEREAVGDANPAPCDPPIPEAPETTCLEDDAK